MAGTYNKVTLVGRLGKDPEMRYTQNGNAVTTFSLATDRGGSDDATDWHNVVCWKKTAEVVNEHLTKGRHILVEGRLQYSEYENKEGQKVRKAEIVADRVVFLGGNGNGKSDSNGKSKAKAEAKGKDDGWDKWD